MRLLSALVALLLFLPRFSESQSTALFDLFVQSVNEAKPASRGALIDSFMTAHQNGFPVTDDSSAHFVFRGSVSSSIVVTGDHTQWSGTGEAMANIPSTDFYYCTRKFEPDARIDYKFVKEGNWILDPLNSRFVNGGFGPNSEMAMPAYVQPPEIQYTPWIPHGSVSSFQFSSTSTGDTRTVKIYLPSNYDSSATRYPSIYVHDGADYLSLGSMANVLDNLIAAKKIQPLIAIFVPPGSDRAGEYRTSKIAQFTNLMIKELVPTIDSLYRTDARAAVRGSMGSSDGGHIALYLAANHSEVFGLAGGQSSTITDLLRTPIQNGPKLPARFYLDVGTYDLSFGGLTFLALNSGYRDLLLSKGYGVTYAQYHEGHSWGNWRAHIDDILLTFFPAAVSGAKRIEIAPQGFRFLNPYPNPFNPSTTIQYELTHSSGVNLTVFSLSGREMETLVNEQQSAGFHSIRWDASRFPSGVYFCRLDASGTNSTQKILFLK